MATGQKFINWYRDRKIAREDMRDHFQEYLKTLLKNNISRSWGRSGLFRESVVQLDGLNNLVIRDVEDRLPGDPDYLRVNGVTVDGNELLLETEYSENIYFPNVPGNTYWVGMYYCETPGMDTNDITKSVYPPKEYGYSYFEERIGVVGVPTNIEIESTYIHIQLSSVLDDDLDQSSRTVIVYLNTPKTDDSNVAFYIGNIQYASGINYVDIPYDLSVGDYPLGQGTNETSNPISDNVEDYRCFIPGVTITNDVVRNLSEDEFCVVLARIESGPPTVINNSEQIYIYYTLDDAYNGLVGQGIGRTIDVKHGAVLMNAPSETEDENLDAGDVKGALLNLKTTNHNQTIVPLIIETKKDDDGSGGVTSGIDIIETFTGESAGINGFPQLLDAIILNDGTDDHLCINNTHGLSVADFDNIYDDLNYISIDNDENKGLFTITNVYDSGEVDGDYGPIAISIRRFGDSSPYTLISSDEEHNISFYFPNLQLGSGSQNLLNSRDGICSFSHPAISNYLKDAHYKAIGYAYNFLEYLYIPDMGSVVTLTGNNHFTVDGNGRISSYNDFISNEPFIKLENNLNVGNSLQLLGYNDGDAYLRVQRLSDGITDTEDWLMFYSEYSGNRHERINLDVGRIKQSISYDEILYSHDTTFLTAPTTWTEDLPVDDFTWNYLRLQGTNAIKLFKQGTGEGLPSFVNGRLEYQFCNKNVIEQNDTLQGSCLVAGQFSLNKEFELRHLSTGSLYSLIGCVRDSGDYYDSFSFSRNGIDSTSLTLFAHDGTTTLYDLEHTSLNLAEFSLQSSRLLDPSESADLRQILHEFDSGPSLFMSIYNEGNDKLALDDNGNLIICGNYFTDNKDTKKIINGIECKSPTNDENVIKEIRIINDESVFYMEAHSDYDNQLIVYIPINGLKPGTLLKSMFFRGHLGFSSLEQYRFYLYSLNIDGEINEIHMYSYGGSPGNINGFGLLDTDITDTVYVSENLAYYIKIEVDCVTGIEEVVAIALAGVSYDG